MRSPFLQETLYEDWKQRGEYSHEAEADGESAATWLGCKPVCTLMALQTQPPRLALSVTSRPAQAVHTHRPYYGLLFVRCRI